MRPSANGLPDEHLFVFVGAVEEDFEAFANAGHDGGDLADRDDDLLIDEFGRVEHLRAVDRKKGREQKCLRPFLRGHPLTQVVITFCRQAACVPVLPDLAEFFADHFLAGFAAECFGEFGHV